MSRVTSVVLVGASSEELASFSALLREALDARFDPISQAFAANGKVAHGDWVGAAFNFVSIPGLVNLVRASTWLSPSEITMVFTSDGFDGTLVMQLDRDKTPHYFYGGKPCGPDHWLFAPGRALDEHR